MTSVGLFSLNIYSVDNVTNCTVFSSKCLL